MKKVLFVCTGNTCRSPMAEAIFNHIASERGLDTSSDSAGLFAADGSPANPNSVKALEEIGIDISSHASAYFDAEAAMQYDLIAAMSEQQADYIALVGIPPEKVISLDVDDPYGGDLEIYRKTRDEIAEKINVIFKRLGYNEC